MGNWSGKKKPRNKDKRKAKVAKRVERKDEVERGSDSVSASSEHDTSSDGAEAPAQSAVRSGASGVLTRVKTWWDELPPQVRIGSMLGVAAVAAVALYQYIDTRASSGSIPGKVPIAATATTTGAIQTTPPSVPVVPEPAVERATPPPSSAPAASSTVPPSTTGETKAPAPPKTAAPAKKPAAPKPPTTTPPPPATTPTPPAAPAPTSENPY